MNVKVTNTLVTGTLALFGALAGSADGATVTGTRVDAWDPKSAATYLDQRAGWWMSWPGAARDHQTFCISCHTAVPYALARPALRAVLGERTLSAPERKLLDNIVTRVRQWNSIKPFYEDEPSSPHNTAQSRGTEAVLSSLVLANNDSENGRLSDDARAALVNMWALQLTSGDARGAWSWLQFNNEPWEGHDSQFYGAALAAVTVGLLPAAYRSTPEIQWNLKLLREYLQRKLESQSPINHAVLLWASAKWQGLLSPEQQSALIRELTSQQQRDGGWNLASLLWTWRDFKVKSLVRMWFRSDAASARPESDGYATALIVLALEQAGLASTDQHLKRGLEWLVRNQDRSSGRWPSFSVNGHRDHSSGMGLFMNDAATAYAVLALQQRP